MTATDYADLVTLESISLVELIRESADPDPVPSAMDDLLADNSTAVNDLLANAVKRLAGHGMLSPRLLNHTEQERLVQLFTQMLLDANMVGRAKLQRQAQALRRKHGLEEGRLQESLSIPHVRQSSNYSCGRAALLSVLQHHGVSAEGIESLGTDPEHGTSAGEIVDHCERLGLPVEAKNNCTLDDLAAAINRGAPCLCAVTMYGGGHWVVVAGVEGDEVTIVDPASDTPQYAMPASKFLDLWHDETEGRDYVHYAIAVGKPAGPDGGCGGEGGKPGPCPDSGDTSSAGKPQPQKIHERQQAIVNRTDAESRNILGKLNRGEMDHTDAWQAIEDLHGRMEANTRANFGEKYRAYRDRMVAEHGKGVLKTSGWSQAKAMFAEHEHAALQALASHKSTMDGIVEDHFTSGKLPPGTNDALIDSHHEQTRVIDRFVDAQRKALPGRGGKFAESLLTEDETANAFDDYLHRKAIDYLRSLVPRLGTDVGLTELFRRTAFTLAVATEQTVLDNVQSVLLDVLRTGSVAGVPSEPGQPREMSATERVQACLDAAGVNPANPQYAEAVVRTNIVSSYNAGYQDEFRRSELFSVYVYSNPHDSRSRPSHAARDGKYYPKDVPFEQVRGEGPEDAINCRCTPIALDKWTWAERKANGAKIADGYPDVPA